MKTRLGTAVLALAVCASAPAAQAGETLFTIDGGWYDMTNASNSAKALFGESGGFAGGARAGVRPRGDAFPPRRRPLLLEGRASASSWTRRRTRSSSSAIPSTSRSSPLYALFGYRFLEGARLRPYIAAGGGAALYDEESEIAGEIIEFSTTKPMGMAVVGADYGRGRVRFGIEAGYSMVPNTIGTGGVSEIYDEDDVGGFTAVGRISFAF